MWLLAAPRDVLPHLRPLVRAHERSREVGGVEAPGALAGLLGEAEGVLVVGERRRSPRTSLPGPFLVDETGRLVPAGWLPDLGEGLAQFALAAARVERRQGEVGPLAVLGQREHRYLRLAGRLEVKLAQPGWRRARAWHCS